MTTPTDDLTQRAMEVAAQHDLRWAQIGNEGPSPTADLLRALIEERERLRVALSELWADVDTLYDGHPTGDKVRAALTPKEPTDG